jgi:hypothetical protein
VIAMNTSNTTYPLLLPKPTFNDTPLPGGPGLPPLNDLKRLTHAQLLQRCADMQTWQTKLLSTINSIQGQNNYWTSIYSNVELGLTKKLAELEALKRENQELRVQRKLDDLLTSKNSSATAAKPLIDPNNLPPEVALRIRQLEDQVRARDLVIELLFARLSPSELTGSDKRQQEKIHEEIQKKLDVHLQRLESELGLSGAPGKEAVAENGSSKNGKRSREIQTDETESLVSESGVKRTKTIGSNPYPSPVSEHNSGPTVLAPNARVAETDGVIDEQSMIEKALEDAFNEFNKDLVNDELEDLFADDV